MEPFIPPHASRPQRSFSSIEQRGVKRDVYQDEFIFSQDELADVFSVHAIPRFDLLIFKYFLSCVRQCFIILYFLNFLDVFSFSHIFGLHGYSLTTVARYKFC